ncbi:MAG: hypothetical protein QOA70_06890 [Nitrososphaeraceae archaeon]|nr:hypothetical protein [Nitrososphaeraceae archaeon]
MIHHTHFYVDEDMTKDMKAMTEKLCKDCGKPGPLPTVSSSVVIKCGDIKTYTYERRYCLDCIRRKAKEKRLKNKAMKEPKLELKPKVIKPYKDLLGPSTQQMRNAKKIRPKTKCNDGWTHSNDNAPVAFGWCF